MRWFTVRWSNAVRVTGWILLVCGLTLGVARAQSEGTVSIDLGMGIAGPGEHALVPVTLSTAHPGGVGRISFEVSFPREFLAFNSVLKTTAAESSQLDIETQLQETGEDAVLRVELSSSNPLPPGDLIQLQFDLSQEAQPNQEFDVKKRGQRGETPQGEALQARGSDGLIIVAVFGEAIPACFFYMH